MPGAAEDLTLPLVIMTSEDTHAKTKTLLKNGRNFGMAQGQIIFIMQDKVTMSCFRENSLLF